jgi:hypothetical protein
VLTAIAERTDGVPLFIEEMTKAVLEAEDEDLARRTAQGVLPRASPPGSALRNNLGTLLVFSQSAWASTIAVTSAGSS